MGSETFAHCVIDGVNHDDGLLRGANHTAVEGFRHQNRGHDAFDIRRFVNHYRGITRTHADGRFAGAVGCFHHAWATGGQDQVDVRVVHQLVGEFNGRLIDPADDVFWRTGGNRCLQHDISRFVGGVFRTWVRREDDAVTGFQAD